MMRIEHPGLQVKPETSSRFHRQGANGAIDNDGTDLDVPTVQN